VVTSRAEAAANAEQAEVDPVEREVLDELQRIVREELELPAEVSPNAHLTRDLGLDSLGLLTAAVGLENRFRVRLDEQDATWVNTAGDLARLVRIRMEEQQP
jgi:acyl carrier protein